MKVAVDGRSLRDGAGERGVARYLRSLLHELATAFPEDQYGVLVPGQPSAAWSPAENVTVRGTRLPGRPTYAAGALLGRPRVDRLAGGSEVAWVPAVAPVAVSRDVPFVLTVHDLSFEHRARDFSPYERAWHRVARPRALARRAARVIAVSDVVRSELLAEWGLPPAKVVAVRSGPGSPRLEPGPAPAGLPEPFLLVVGALESRKRPDLVVEAHALARRRGLRSGLVFAGDGPLREAVARSGATVLGRVGDRVLEALYRQALAVVCPSREEGFGFTPLEAMARGTPAVVSALPVFLETLGDAALRVPPDDPASLADALLRLERDEQLRGRLAAAGADAARALSWERAARQTREVLAEARGKGT